MLYDIKIKDNNYREHETIRGVTDSQRYQICQALIRLGVHFKVNEVRLTPLAADVAFCACPIFIPSYESTVAKCRICGKPPRQ